MLPKLRVGKWPTLYFQGMENCRHFFSEGWKVAEKVWKLEPQLKFMP